MLINIIHVCSIEAYVYSIKKTHNWLLYKVVRINKVQQLTQEQTM